MFIVIKLIYTYIYIYIEEVAKLFADAGLICIASLISPYRKDRDACRAMLTDANFIEAMLLSVCYLKWNKCVFTEKKG